MQWIALDFTAFTHGRLDTGDTGHPASGILYEVALKEADFRRLIEKALRARGVSAIRAARSAGISRDAIRSVLRGRSPSFDRVAEICEVLGLDFRIGLPADAGGSDTAGPEDQSSEDAQPPPVPLTRFSSGVMLPIRDWEQASPEGRPSSTHDTGSAPAPVDLPDPYAFYLRPRDYSMVPAGIWSGDYCLISPYAKVKTNQLAWFRNRNGQETIRWLFQLAPTCYELLGWGPPDGDGHQKLVAEQWMCTDVVDRGVVLAVYRNVPSVDRPPFRVPDWHPGEVAGPHPR